MKIGFVGLGTMGGHMARHLAKHHELAVFDVDRAKVDAIDEATGAASVADVAHSAEVVLLSLPSSAAFEEVSIGEDGLAAHLAGGSTVIDVGTTEPPVTKRIAKSLAANGIGFLDAPVSGGEGGAREANLSIMVGGDQEVFDRCKPLLQIIAASVVRVGDVGAGEVAKLINNMIVASTFAVIAEGFALGKKTGLDAKTLYDAIKGGWAASAVLNVAVPGIIDRDFVPGGTVNLMSKDIGFALSLARSENVPTPVTAIVDEVFKTARASGRGLQAQQVIIQLWEELLNLS